MASTGIPTIGLCFSGGGFRASFYALGVLRYLAEAERLGQIVAISSVSGGAIAAGVVGDRWGAFQSQGGDVDAFLKAVDAPFRTTVTSKNIRRRWMWASVLGFVPGAGGRGGVYGWILSRHLYEHKYVSGLPQHPEFIFTSTDLSKGRSFRVAPAYVGSWDYGYIEPTPSAVKLGKAVAASAAFPPSMTVVNLDTRDLWFPDAQPPKKLSLVDGGVYDNLGLEWFQGWTGDAKRPSAATEPKFVVVVNASGRLARAEKRFFPAGAFKRDLSIQYQQSLNVRVRWLVERLNAQPGSGAYLAINDDPGQCSQDPTVQACALPTELVAPLAALRTDLDRFSRDEADLLSYHAYWNLHACLLEHAPDLAAAAPSWKHYADLTEADVDRLVRLMKIGSHRFFRGVRRRLPGGDLA